MLNRLGLIAALALGTATAALAQDATPKDGGKLVFTAPYGNSITSLDITATPHTQDEIVAKAINRSLYKWNPESGKPELDLAGTVEKSADGKTYTYKLREATFHNGDKLDADDVIWSYNRLADPKKALPGAEQMLQIAGVAEFQAGKADHISGLKKIDDRTIEITFINLADPGWNLMSNYAPIYSKDYPEDQLASKPNGLGPFKLANYVAGSKVELEKFDGYYEKGKPHLDKLDIMLMGEASARDVAFRNAEIDTNVLGPVQYEAYSQDPALKDHILEVAEVYTRNIGFNPKVEAFKDKRVRQAINYAINKDLIVEKLLKNKAYPAVSWLPISSPAFDKDAKPYAYDPEKAKELLKEAGFETGLKFSVTATSNESWGLPIVEAIIPMLAKVGVTVTTDPVESSVLSDKILSDNFDAFIWSNSSGPDPLKYLNCFYSKTSQTACNYVKFNNADFDKLIEQAGNETDPAKQNDLLRQANNLLQDEAPVWFFNYNKAVMAYQPWVHGLKPNGAELAIQDYEDIWIDDSAPASRK
ncbi:MULTISPECIES: ABC transporter substrate-binding protein [unclassified Mesorhizobium]|uniref:ABC transporter substrate-binding protein n=1 Tax=unclassified Mesorhizobium TaxID=325217 RepID=UPI001126DACC|nr:MULTISPECIES: ABC transporter substrate-binding protein [unclassified Mesorhizobium]TPK62061.1 ABC transporter substrate-binding protein [Mesorhizobium sp. B2-5-1]TPM64737.1 ABC transporter substrate-binding protein [Mesorhizobium sp. B2-1-9]TPM80742.1 ABC transporter substrate-binding protein [Mesorhizobium sp. B2-1-4]TPN06607.1 ABC transporter substrate-binding protein [Mesorhizobium sp. B2-1-2]UCI12747.1 ABC transporter substrate-binding protein [Mesorhizobium sp. B2-1-1]